MPPPRSRTPCLILFFLGDKQITAVAANYCISYNLPIHLSLPLPPTLEHFHLSILSTFMLALLSDSHPFFSCTPQPHKALLLCCTLFFLFTSLLLTCSVLFPSASCSTLSPSPSPPVSFPIDCLPTTSGYSFTQSFSFFYPCAGHCQLLLGLSQACSSPALSLAHTVNSISHSLLLSIQIPQKLHLLPPPSSLYL